MIQLYKSPKILKTIYPDLTWDINSEKEIFLTFDDGPHPEITKWVLDQLDDYDAKATFFCVGKNLEDFKQTALETTKRGHLLANHSQNHEDGRRTENEDYYQSLSACLDKIEDIQGVKRKLFRPPYGQIKRQQIRQIRSEYQIVMWSHLAWDFKSNLKISESIENLMKAKPGSIIVFHDNEKSFNNLKQILPKVLAYWASKNYKFNTLSNVN
ncbi:MAG: polysaccharide deacetylase family protein [Cyclobacteriaceae bacterium]